MSADMPADGPESAVEPRRTPVPFLGPLICVLVCVVLFPSFTVLYVTYQAAQIKAYEAHAQEQNNHKFCGIVDTLAAPHPPAGTAHANPSRAFEQILHSKVIDLKRGLGC